MQEWMKRSERNVKRQKNGEYSNAGCVKDLRIEKDLLRYAQGYKYKEYIKVQTEIIKCGEKENKPNQMKYICIYYVRDWSCLNEKWEDGLEKKKEIYI